jgi:NADPH-dependent glutamate synthase beta subunit-like oxidoreductase
VAAQIFVEHTEWTPRIVYTFPTPAISARVCPLSIRQRAEIAVK